MFHSFCSPAKQYLRHRWSRKWKWRHRQDGVGRNWFVLEQSRLTLVFPKTDCQDLSPLTPRVAFGDRTSKTCRLLWVGWQASSPRQRRRSCCWDELLQSDQESVHHSCSKLGDALQDSQSCQIHSHEMSGPWNSNKEREAITYTRHLLGKFKKISAISQKGDKNRSRKRKECKLNIRFLHYHPEWKHGRRQFPSVAASEALDAIV